MPRSGAGLAHDGLADEVSARATSNGNTSANTRRLCMRYLTTGYGRRSGCMVAICGTAARSGVVDALTQSQRAPAGGETVTLRGSVIAGASRPPDATARRVPARARPGRPPRRGRARAVDQVEDLELGAIAATADPAGGGVLLIELELGDQLGAIAAATDLAGVMLLAAVDLAGRRPARHDRRRGRGGRRWFATAEPNGLPQVTMPGVWIPYCDVSAAVTRGSTR